MELFHTETCVRFIERTNETDYVIFHNAEGILGSCNSNLGHRGGAQIVCLHHPECTRKEGTIQHEMMHILGFAHEHTRPDRDDHVTIIWDNIDKGKFFMFNLVKLDVIRI